VQSSDVTNTYISSSRVTVLTASSHNIIGIRSLTTDAAVAAAADDYDDDAYDYDDDYDYDDTVAAADDY